MITWHCGNKQAIIRYFCMESEAWKYQRTYIVTLFIYYPGKLHVTTQKIHLWMDFIIWSMCSSVHDYHQAWKLSTCHDVFYNEQIPLAILDVFLTCCGCHWPYNMATLCNIHSCILHARHCRNTVQLCKSSIVRV